MTPLLPERMHRHQVGQRAGRDDHAAGVDRQMARQLEQGFGFVEDALVGGRRYARRAARRRAKAASRPPHRPRRRAQKPYGSWFDQLAHLLPVASPCALATSPSAERGRKRLIVPTIATRSAP